MTTQLEKIPRHIWIICGVAMLGAVMSILDTTIVNVSLQTLQSTFHEKNLATTQWVVTAYMLSLAAVIPITGWASRNLGAKQIFMISLILFTLGSMACGLAQNMTELIIFRVIQGVGGGMIMPLAQIIMADAAGPKNMGRVMSLVAIPMMLAPTLGPLLGGVIIQDLSWRWIFDVNVPVGLIAVPLAFKFLPHTDRSNRDSLDVLGLCLMSTGLVGITYGLAELGMPGATIGLTKVWLPLAAGVALAAAFAFHAFRAKNPLLDLNLYRRWHFSAASIVMFALGAAVFGAMILMPLYWQEVRGFSVIKTGLLTGPQGLGMALIMPLSGKLTARYGGGPVALVGVLVTAVTTIPFALIGPHTSVLFLAIAMSFRGVGMGCSFMPAMTAAYAALERKEVSHATPQLNVLNRVGGSIGTTILAVVLQRAEVAAHKSTIVQAHLAHTPQQLAAVKAHGLLLGAHAFGTAFWWSVGLAGIALIPCIVLMKAEQAHRQAGTPAAANAAGEPAQPHTPLAEKAAQALMPRDIPAPILAEG